MTTNEKQLGTFDGKVALEIANAVVFLASTTAATSPERNCFVDGGIAQI